MAASSPLSSSEMSRLAALEALALLDTPPEAEFDAIARLASEATGCATGALTLLSADRLWIKASSGPAPDELPRHESFCNTTVGDDVTIVVEDARADPRFAHLQLVRDGIRFYAGVPIGVIDDDGIRQPVGALCVIDEATRTLSDEQYRAFTDLARLAEALMSARRLAREALVHAAMLERQRKLFDQAERLARIGWWRLSLDTDRLEWSDGIYRIYELPLSYQPVLSEGLDCYPPAERAVVSRALATAIETGEPFDFEVDFISSKGTLRRVRCMGEMEGRNGSPPALIGVFRDVTEEHALSRALQRSADTDPLTHIANRGAFVRSLDDAIRAATDAATPFALVLIDLDGFKRINDTFGHIAGDEVLKTVARRLHGPWLADSFAARLGGDEFAIIIDDPALLADEDALVERITSELQVSSTVDSITLESGASVGLLRFDPARFTSQREFIQAADRRLYVTKRARVGDRRAA